MRAMDIMNTPVITILSNATVAEVADLMLEHQISCLPVLDGQGQLQGILTHTDFVLRHKFLQVVHDLYTLLGSWTKLNTLEKVALDVRSKLVKDVMRNHVFTVQEDTPVAQVVELMVNQRVNRLPIMRGKQLVGIITRHDLLKLMEPDKWRLVKAETQPYL